MLLNLLLTSLGGVTGVLLLEKWQVDDYMNTHPVWSRFWPAEPCLLCRGFWVGVLCYLALLYVPNAVYVLLPLAAIPAQVLLTSILVKR